MTIKQFRSDLGKGLYEDNLESIIKGLTGLLKSNTRSRERAAFYLIRAVLDDIAETWIRGQPVDFAFAQRLHAAIAPKVNDVLDSLSKPEDVQLEAMGALVTAYLIPPKT